MWDLIVSVPDHCLSFYFVKSPEICDFRAKMRFSQKKKSKNRFPA